MDTDVLTADELEALAHERISEGHALLARARRMRTEPASDAWLTLDAAGALVGVKGRVIRDGGRRGELVIEHAGKSPRVRRSEVERWVASRKTPAPSTVQSPREAARAAVADRAKKRSA